MSKCRTGQYSTACLRIKIVVNTKFDMKISRVLLGLATTCAVWGQGAPPPGGGPSGRTSTPVTYYATYKLDGGTASQSNQIYTATAADTSAVWAANSGALTLIDPSINTSGNTSSTDNSSFAGLNAALLAATAAQISVTGGTIATTGLGANGAFATGTGSSVSLTNTTIKTTGDGGHAVMVSQGATMNVTNVNMTTSATGRSSTAPARPRGPAMSWKYSPPVWAPPIPHSRPGWCFRAPMPLPRRPPSPSAAPRRRLPIPV